MRALPGTAAASRRFAPPRAVRRPRRLLRTAVTVSIAVLLVGGCSSSTPETADPALPATASRQVGPENFGEEIAGGDRFVVNVHTPEEGVIAGTDAAIAFDQLQERAAELPQDRAAALGVYCMTGAMSEAAVRTLVEMGYTDLVELRGGMVAWSQDDRPLLPLGTDHGSVGSGSAS